ncbi:MAG: molybdopterin-dependent oxidoreductase, partial [archaeon]|nr:molybdopterin-dependent oxidoreductase [archaeon]
FNNHKDRLKEPLMKKYGKLAPVKWEEAYEKILENFKKFKPNEIAFLVSTDLSNESAYMINDFVLNKLKSDNIGIISDEDSIDLFKKLQVIPHSISKIEISEYILLINANPQISHPNLLINLNKAKNIGSNIISLNFDNISIPNETSAILDEEEYLSENEIIKKIEDFDNKKNVTIILGNQYSTKIVNSILDLASKSKEINLIQLKSRTNFEGVMTIIPKSEEKIIQAIDDGEIKALYLTERIDKKYLKNLEYLVIQDIFPSDNFEFADIILPVCSFLEDSGTILDIELKKKKFNKCIPCSGDQKPDWQIFLDLIEKLEEIKPKISGIQDLITLVNKKYPINFSSVKESPSLLSSVDSKIYGRPVFSNYFQYRGEKISNKVKEFMNLVEYRENIKKKSKPKSIKNKKKGIDIEIDINGNVIIGSKIYGLSAILPIIKVIKSSGNDVNIILEPFNNNLLYLQQERFCLCNNYKKNLSKAQVLIELKEDLCKTYIRTKSKSKKLEPIGGVVLIKREFVETNDKFIPTGNENLFDNDDALDPGMLRRAIAACQSIIRSSDLIINKSNTNSVESESDKKKSSLVWDIWHYQRQNSGKGNDLIKAKIYNAISDKLDAYSLRDDFPDYLYYIIVHIDEERCIGCGNCIKICPHEAISFNYDNKKYIFGDRKIQKAEINPLKCYNCATCLSECPVNAISINKWNERPFFAIIEDIAEKAFEKE